jgi:hypothetical protein
MFLNIYKFKKLKIYRKYFKLSLGKYILIEKFLEIYQNNFIIYNRKTVNYAKIIR